MSVRLVVNNLCLLILVMDNNQSLLRKEYYCVIEFNLLYYELLSENKRINQVRNATSEAKYLTKKKIDVGKNDIVICKFSMQTL